MNTSLYIFINPLTQPGEGVTVFTSPYLSAGAPALGEAKGLIIRKIYNFMTVSNEMYIIITNLLKNETKFMKNVY